MEVISKQTEAEQSSPNVKDNQQISIYQRFKRNSHKIMIDVPKEGAFNDAKQNTKLEAIKKRIENGKLNLKPKPKTNESMPNIGLLNQSLEEIPEDAQQSILGSIGKSKKKDKDDVNLSTNLKEIENRILMKIKNSNKTDRKLSNLNSKITRTQNDNVRSSINLKSPGSDKSDSLFPIIANSSITSAYSTPYVKNSDQENDFKMGMSKDKIKDAMNRIKKSVARSQSIRNGDLSKTNDEENDYSHKTRETPYDNNSSILNKSRINSESK